MGFKSTIRGEQVKDESIDSVDIASGSIKAGELSSEAISGQTLITEPSGDNDRLLVWDATDSALKQVAPDKLFTEADTRIGIGTGTDAPDNTLHVKSPGTCHIKIESDAGSEAALKIKSGGQSTAYIWQPGNTSDLRFYVNSADRMHIDNDGNVGIGTTDPDYNLHVSGAASAVVLIDGASGADAFLRFGQAGTLKSYIKHGSGGHLVMTNETADKDIIFNIKDNTISREGLRLNGNVAEVVVNEGSDSLVDFRVESDSQTHMLFVDGGNNKVGVGTDAPVTTLHIKGDPGQFRIEDTTVDYAYTVDCDGDGIRTHFGDMTDGESGEDAFMSFGAYTGINRLDTASRDFHIYGTNTTTGFYFDESAGNFGIGTATPGSTLDISGSVSLKVSGLKTSNYTIAADDHTVVADCGSGNVTLTLPSATGAMAGRIYVIKRTDTSNHGINTLTIDPAGSNIDGVGSDKIMANLDALVFQCLGLPGWILIGSYMAPM